ncbi:hypothetical protein ACHAW6_013961 [Cyclotella cf. meneghiniana]
MVSGIVGRQFSLQLLLTTCMKIAGGGTCMLLFGTLLQQFENRAKVKTNLALVGVIHPPCWRENIITCVNIDQPNRLHLLHTASVSQPEQSTTLNTISDEIVQYTSHTEQR